MLNEVINTTLLCFVKNYKLKKNEKKVDSKIMVGHCVEMLFL